VVSIKSVFYRRTKT